MNTNQLKFMLRLLASPDHSAGWTSSALEYFKKEKSKICQELEKREYVDYSREIVSAQILPAGKAALQIESSQLPIAPEEIKVLQNIAKSNQKIEVSKIKIKSLKSDEKDGILKILSERGLIKVEQKIKRTKAQVWLTDRGLEFLRDEYIPQKDSHPVISLDMLGAYIQFLRKNAQGKKSVIPREITDEEILQTIENLDRELGTENYLPIFHVREKLQPPLSRDDLDQALYRLQKMNKIDFDPLQEVTNYTGIQIDAGIPQNIGGPLFFIIVN
ncbi:transcription factor RcaD [Cylindrospermopsis raciborskii S07]|uniref:Transcription factor RcaD n=3 Tax=Cylindrospermopsis raciborskii TaxID=77022 RepID=A0A853MF13_9CYAN|nr:hypothetical protein [Cylindrospermopsis raciborskii]PNJ96930.1 transcription factor RcaD [Cylindrospermopsis raciborskii C03]PNJ98005.1 transcription factor RcaD [Cylindrospermopsis raciborskii C04]PNJ99958.1 transcription factor RcaD [Cylindrospermopsis raciborskii C07]PNK04344.1 transcription factor RcaD [Cylindrospermopsis raciborskii S07]PNK08297.1 transcription factor RcaD [Cylindrospermopsis raciborskii S10]PNK10371.1 transcription factor RcaD [Cylindrospermopsis raciborskii S06]PN